MGSGIDVGQTIAEDRQWLPSPQQRPLQRRRIDAVGQSADHAKSGTSQFYSDFESSLAPGNGRLATADDGQGSARDRRLAAYS